MSVFRVRKVAFINFGLLFIFLSCWMSWYIYPLAKSFFVEEDLFYGKVSYAAVPSLFGGTNIPFFDKIFFQLNGDTKCTFVLYANDEILDEMAEWYDFSATNASDIPMEVRDKYIVKSMESTDGKLGWEFLMDGYHFYWCFMGVSLVAFMFTFGLVLVVVGILYKPRRVVEQESSSDEE